MFGGLFVRDGVLSRLVLVVSALLDARAKLPFDARLGLLANALEIRIGRNTAIGPALYVDAGVKVTGGLLSGFALAGIDVLREMFKLDSVGVVRPSRLVEAFTMDDCGESCDEVLDSIERLMAS